MSGCEYAVLCCLNSSLLLGFYPVVYGACHLCPARVFPAPSHRSDRPGDLPCLDSPPDAPVAVLFENRTASSGEVIVISFIGRRNTRSFASSSAGYTTSNEGFKLSDQAIIFLATAVMADRTGRVYGDVIIPDVITEGNNNCAGPIPDESMQWLGDQPACQ